MKWWKISCSVEVSKNLNKTDILGIVKCPEEEVGKVCDKLSCPYFKVEYEEIEI